MTAPLGTVLCPTLGCQRARHVSASGIHYSTCLACATTLLRRAFAHPDAESGAGAMPVASPGHRRGSSPRLDAELVSTAATRGG